MGMMLPCMTMLAAGTFRAQVAKTHVQAASPARQVAHMTTLGCMSATTHRWHHERGIPGCVLGVQA